VELEFELRTLSLWNGCSMTWSMPLVHFALVTLETGSHEVFPWVDLEPWPFWFQTVARTTGMSNQCLLEFCTFKEYVSILSR
jgi:hypothetical protein